MTLDADVVVIGAGGAGLAAAVSAAENGAEVIVLEKAPEIGGSTVRSVGALTAPLTSYQEAAGIHDSIEEFEDDIRTTNGAREERENTALRRLYAENAGPTIEWLRRFGVRFLGPFPEPSQRVPRLHNVLPNSASYGAALRARARKLGVTIRTGAGVQSLEREDGGWVVVASSGVFRSRAVIIASGDFSAASDILADMIGSDAARIPAINSWNTGDGQRLGERAGGVATQMDTAFEGLRYVPRARKDFLKAMPPGPWFSRLASPVARHMPRPIFEFFVRGALVGWVSPDPAVYEAGAIQVDATGRRLEHDGTPPSTARAVAATGFNRSYTVLDAEASAAFSKDGRPIAAFPGVASAHLDNVRRRRPDLIRTAPTAEALARLIGADPAILAASIADAPGRELAGPFTALGPLEAVITLTNGGLVVDTSLRVLDGAGQPIPGLYAAGSAGQGGLQLLNHGLHIGWALTSGRLAGLHAAEA